MTRILFSALLVLALAAPAAGAATRNQIIRDCADGSLDGNYTASEMRDARNNLPADVDEYTDCRDLLTRATHSGGSGASGDGASTGGAGAGGGTAGGQPLTPQSPQEQQALDEARTGGAAPVEIDGETIVPGASGFAADAARRDLPAPLIVLLALLAAAALASAVPQIRKRVLSRRPA